ncbi:MAG TPA: hypothetical protein VF489_08800, partial [Sphingobium sp.]
MTTSFSFLATCLLAASAPALAQAAATLPEKGKPPLTERTEASGLPLAPEQKAVDFTTADLAIEVFP